MGLGVIQGVIRLVDDWTPQLNMVVSGMQRFGQFQRQWAMNLGLFGAAMTAAITLPMGAMMKAAADFEQQFANVVKTVESLDVNSFGKLNKAAAELKDQLRGIAQELPFAHKELAAIAAFGGQFGVPTDDLAKFTEVVAKLGTAVDGIETETAAKGLAQILTITGLDVGDNIERLASELVHLGNVGISTEGTILEITRRMSGAGHTAGMSAKFMMSLSAAVANLGHRSELGGTALANTVLKIDRAVSRGGDALATFARVSQKTAEQFKADWGRSSQDTLMDLFAKIAALPIEDRSSAVAAMFGTAARHTQVLLSLVSAYPMLAEQVRQGDRAFIQSAALQEEFRKKATTFWNQLEVVKNKLRDVVITLGGPFLDVLREMIVAIEPILDLMKNLAQAFEDANPITQRLVVIFMLMVAALPLMAVGASAVQYTFGQLLGVMSGLGNVLGWAALNMTGTTTTTAALSVSVNALSGAATTLVTSIELMSARFAAFIANMPGFWRMFDLANSAIWRFIDSVARMTILEGLAAIVNVLNRAFAGFIGVLASIGVLAGVVAILSDLRDVLVHFGVIAVRVESKDLSTWDSFKNILVDLGQAFKNILGPMWEFINGMSTLEKLAVAIPGASQFILANRAKNLFTQPTLEAPSLPSRYEGVFKQGITGATGPYKKLTAGERYLQSLNTFSTDDSIDKMINERTQETMVSFYRSISEGFDMMSDSSDKAAKASEALAEAQRLVNEQFEKSKTFEEYLGFGDFEKFTQMNEAFNRMKELNITPPKEFTEAFGKAAQGTIDYLYASHGLIAIPPRIHEIANAYNELNLSGEVAGVQNKKIFDQFEDFMKNQPKLIKDLRNAQFELFGGRMSADISKIVDQFREFAEVQDDLKEMPAGVDPEMWKKFVSVTNQINVEKIARAVRETAAFANFIRILSLASPTAAKGIKELFDSFGGDIENPEPKLIKPLKTFTESFKDSVKDMGSAFNRLANIMGDSYDGLLKRIGDIVALMAVGVEIGETIREVFTKTYEEKDPVTGEVKKVTRFDMGNLSGENGAGVALESYIKLFSAAVQGFALMQKATDVKGRGNRVMNGAMSGASIGSAFGPWGTVIGFAVGALWGAFRKLKWEEIGNRIASRMGVEIDEQLSRSIANTAKEIFGGNMLAAETFHIGDIIQQVGVTKENFGELAWAIRDIFVMIEDGSFTLEQAATALDKSFQNMLDEGTDKMGFIRRELREIVALTYSFGVQSKEVLKYMTSMGNMLLEQVDALASLPAKYDEWLAIGEAITEARNAIAEAGNDVDKVAKANDDLTAALTRQAAAAEIAQAELENLGVVIAGNVFAAMLDGRTLASAILGARDGLKKFFDIYKSLGMTPEDPLVKLLYTQSAIVEAIPNVISGLDAIGNSIVGLTNMNLLDPKMFSSIQTSAMTAYTAIQAQVAAVGGTTRDALLPMQDYLHKAERAARELGIPLDETTQMMIDQSKELGIWKEVGPSATELMTSAIGGLVTKIGELIDKMFGIPDDLPDPFRNWNTPEIPGFDPNKPPGWVPDPSEPGRAVGSIVASGNWFEDWGAGTSVKLHNKEAVIRPDQALPFAAHVLGAYAPEGMSGGGGGGGGTIPVILRVKNKDILTEVVMENADGFLTKRGVRRG